MVTKRVRLTFLEVATFATVLEVPADFPETLADVQASTDWLARVNAQPDSRRRIGVEDVQLQQIELVTE